MSNFDETTDPGSALSEAEPAKYSYKFEDIVSPYLYLGREHMEQFRVLHMPDEAVAQTARAFQALVDPIGPPTRIGDPRPKLAAVTYGLEVVDRDSQNYEELHTSFAPNWVSRDVLSRMVQAYGVVEYTSRLSDDEFRAQFDLMKSKDSVRYRILQGLGVALKQQIK